MTRYLSPDGLQALLYSEEPKRSEGGVSDHYGRTLIVHLPFHDRSMTPNRVALILGRMVIHFHYKYRGTLPFARVDPSMAASDQRLGWSSVAWELTRAVWELGADRELVALGLASAVERDVDDRKDQLSAYYGSSYTPAPLFSNQDVTGHMQLARVAAALPQSNGDGLINRAARVAPAVAAMAAQGLPALRAVDLQNPGTVLEALLRLHDAHPIILASVAVYDPLTGTLSGRGVNADRAKGSSQTTAAR